MFLLGAFMVIKQGAGAGEVLDHFSWLDASLIEPFRDASFNGAAPSPGCRRFGAYPCGTFPMRAYNIFATAAGTCHSGAPRAPHARLGIAREGE